MTQVVSLAHCNALQHAATHCNTLQNATTQSTHIPTLRNTLQHPATPCNSRAHTPNTHTPGAKYEVRQDWNAKRYNTLQHAATQAATQAATHQNGPLDEGHEPVATPEDRLISHRLISNMLNSDMSSSSTDVIVGYDYQDDLCAQIESESQGVFMCVCVCVCVCVYA